VLGAAGGCGEATVQGPSGPDAKDAAVSDVIEVTSGGPCLSSPAGSPCDDGNPCTKGEQCGKAGCGGGVPLDCDDDNPCTADLCEPKSGCTHSPAEGACQAGCQVGVCQDGKCQGTDKLRLFAEKVAGLAAAEAHAAVFVGGALFAAGWIETGEPDGRQALLLRADPSGALTWQRAYGKEGPEEAQALVALPDGGFGLAGLARAKDATDKDFFAARTDASGAVLWTRTWGGHGDEEALAVCGRAAGGLALTGTRDAHLWVVLADGSGQKVADSLVGASGSQRGRAIVELDGGNLLVIGRSDAHESQGGFDGWLLLLDAGAKLLWYRTFGGAGADELLSVAVLADGYLLGGASASASAGGSDMWLLRVDKSGKQIWSRTYGALGDEAVESLAVAPDGSAVLAGWTTSNSAGARDDYVLGVDAFGNRHWATHGAGTEDEVISAVVRLPGGDLMYAGSATQAGAKEPGVRLARSDAWGHFSCADAGKCADLAALSCTDTEPCTADICHGAQGCLHPPFPEGSPCGGAKTCGNGICK
jgi:hypothetical protein